MYAFHASDYINMKLNQCMSCIFSDSYLAHISRVLYMMPSLPLVTLKFLVSGACLVTNSAELDTFWMKIAYVWLLFHFRGKCSVAQNTELEMFWVTSTLVWFQFSVSSICSVAQVTTFQDLWVDFVHMCFHIGLLAEAFLADWTGKLALFVMDILYVSPQVTSSGVGPVAVGAHHWFCLQ